MTTINYDELASAISDVTVIDVRNRAELKEHGTIPGSHSIPLPEFGSALEMDEDSFKSKYGFEKPPSDAQIVTHCMMGGRAMKAYELLSAEGYSNAKCYSGSFKDWVKNGGEVVKED